MHKLIFGLVIAVFLGGIVYTVAWYGTEEEITITVTDKERIVEASGSGEDATVSSKYLVFTDKETFENTDALFLGKFNSSDIQGRLHKDSTYTVVVYGWRIPFLSSYRNIVEIK